MSRRVMCSKCSGGWVAIDRHNPNRCRVCAGQGFHTLGGPAPPAPVRKPKPGPAPSGQIVVCSTCGREFSRQTIIRHQRRCAVTRHGSKPDLACPCGRVHATYADRRRCPAFQCDQQHERPS